jgi:NAD(P)-dependent dehydrogenase (short-subunit alcohol dehydrogenase family)
VEAAVKFVKQHIGRLTALINNAGIANPVSGPIERLSQEDWNRVLNTNLTGAFLMVKHNIPLLTQSGGSIINIASTRALQSEPETEAYAATKGGLVALTHALAISLGPKIRVNCISPGWIDVSQWQKIPPYSREPLNEADHRQHPAGRIGIPDDVASLAAFLLSAEAGFITGQNFVVDGGMTRKMIYV